MMKLYIIFGLIALSTAYAVPERYFQPPYPDTAAVHAYRDEPFTVTPTEFRSYLGITDEDEIDMPVVYIRERRSLQPGAPNFPLPGSQLPTSITSNVERQGPNTAATINAQHKTDRYDVGATWSKVIRGPGKSKPNWSVGGTYRW
uniref:Coleoptericin A n=1 Tax=Trypoxylus dichotomus TaxID=273928 RepID=Q9BLK8_TRYDI|nr:coleoptericin A [Trypoxylus dichotomus]